MSDSNQSAKRIVDGWIRLAEAAGVEMTVTFVVDGVIITGMLTPVSQFAAWFKEVVHRAGASAKGQSNISGIMVPMTAEQQKEVQRSWDDEMRELGKDSDDDVVFTKCALKNVTLCHGMPVAWIKLPYLIVSADAITAASLGAVGGTTQNDG